MKTAEQVRSIQLENLTSSRVIIANKEGKNIVDLPPYILSQQISVSSLESPETFEAFQNHINSGTLAIWNGKSQIRQKVSRSKEYVASMPSGGSVDGDIFIPTIPIDTVQASNDLSALKKTAIRTKPSYANDIVYDPPRNRTAAENVSPELDVILPIMNGGHDSIEGNMFGEIVQRSPKTQVTGGQAVSLQQMVIDKGKQVTKSVTDFINDVQQEREKDKMKPVAKSKPGPKPKTVTGTTSTKPVPKEIQEFMSKKFLSKKSIVGHSTDEAFLQLVITHDKSCETLAKKRLEEISK